MNNQEYKEQRVKEWLSFLKSVAYGSLITQTVTLTSLKRGKNYTDPQKLDHKLRWIRL